MNTQPDAPLQLPPEAERVAQSLQAARNPVIVSHIRPDGDALGACLGLAHMLALRGANALVAMDSPVPGMFAFLPGAEAIACSPDALTDDYDAVVILDVPDRRRMGEVRKWLTRGCPHVAIDHHPHIEQVGDPEWRDTAMSSTGEMVYALARHAGWAIPPEAATCLYAAIITDTGRFCFPNTRPGTLRAAADLMALGADCLRVVEHCYEREPFEIMALRAEAMATIRRHGDGRIAVMRMTQDMLKRHGVSLVDVHDFANIPRALEDVDVGVTLVELDGAVKVSLRSRSGVNIAAVARHFDGGGHEQAAGCEIAGVTLDTAQGRVLAELAEKATGDRPS